MGLTQKDIDNLQTKEKRYMLSVGEPKELYIRVYPTGKKVFYLRASKFKNFITLGENRKGILSLSSARIKANELLKSMYENNFTKSLKSISLESANMHYLETKGKSLAQATIKKEQLIFNKYIKSLFQKDINALCKDDFLSIFDLLYQKNINETLRRLINYLCRILEFQKARGVLKTHIISDLKELLSYYKSISIKQNVKHYKALTSEKDIKNLLECLKAYTKEARTSLSVCNALYFTLLTAQRSKNIRFAKWQDIDFKAKIWTIKAKDMKVSLNGDNIVPLNEYALKVLEKQRLLSAGEFVFMNNDKFLSDNFGVKFFKKYDLKHTIHGFRSSFKTQCVENETLLLKRGISLNTSELILHHTKGDEVQKAYNRALALTQRIDLMAWWGEFLNSLCSFEIY